MYGTGMRLMECIRLRAGDLDFGNRLIVVRNGKGGKDRIVPLPERLRAPLDSHLERVKALRDRDLAAGAEQQMVIRGHPSIDGDCDHFFYPSAQQHMSKATRLAGAA